MTPEDLFATYFLPLYPEDMRSRPETLAAARLVDENPGGNLSFGAHLAGAAALFVANAGVLFGRDLALDGSDDSIHRLSAALTRERRDAWAVDGAPGTPANVLFNAVVHGAAYVGTCVVNGHGGAWNVRRPLWESVVRLTSRAGEADLAVFHWWLKSLAADALLARSGDLSLGPSAAVGAATLADRYRAHVEVPCASPEALPVLTTRARVLPRLKAPTFDRLYKYFRAHLPEVRDFGKDFPSAERFAAFEFSWIDAHLVGAGRMVLLAGASPKGMHLFWLGANGFEKGAFFAGDSFPEPIVKLRDNRIVVMTSVAAESQVYETFWWGP
jgi:hypothetical protein